MTTAFGDRQALGGAPGGALCGARQAAALATAGTTLEPLRLGDRLVGTTFEDRAARYCVLTDLRSGDPDRSPPEQAREVFETMEAGLAVAGMDFRHVIRTWFYLRDILDWYDAFNRVRTGFFAQRRIFDGVVPASTGVGMSTPDGAAVVADLLAIRPKRADVRVCSVPSPLQCCAREYGSSFSRAVEVAFPGPSADGADGADQRGATGAVWRPEPPERSTENTEGTDDRGNGATGAGAVSGAAGATWRAGAAEARRAGRRTGGDGERGGLRRLYVSGTASIDAAGRTLHAGDVQRQVAETMSVVQAILDSRGMTWCDVAAGVAYFRRPEDAPVLGAYVREHGLPALPLAMVCGEICRKELLFEMEVEAWRAGS